MARTTLDLDSTVLEELKKLKLKEGKPMGQLASELMSQALAEERSAETNKPLQWTAKSMNAQVDIEDKEAVNRLINGT